MKKLSNRAMIGNELTQEEIKRNLDEVKEGIMTIEKAMKILSIPEEVLEREIKPFGNASHIVLPKDYTNRKAKIIIEK